MASEVGSPSEREKQFLWHLAVATGALWHMSDLTESELLGFVDLKAQKAPSYLAEYRSALRLFAATGHEQATPHAVAAVLRHPSGVRAEHARQFVIAEFVALHLACGGFRQFGLARFRGFVGDDYAVASIQPGTRR